MDVRAAGPLLHVPIDSRIPKVCLRCGTRHDVLRHEQTFLVGSGGQGVAFIGPIIGVMTAATVRAVVERPVMQALVILVVIAVVVPLAVLIQRGLPKVAVAVPLCRECDEARMEGQRLVIPLLAGLGVAVLFALGGLALESVWVMALSGLLFVGVIGYAWIVRPRGPKVFPVRVTHEEIVFKLDPRVHAKIARRLEKRAARSIVA